MCFFNCSKSYILSFCLQKEAGFWSYLFSDTLMIFMLFSAGFFLVFYFMKLVICLNCVCRSTSTPVHFFVFL